MIVEDRARAICGLKNGRTYGPIPGILLRVGGEPKKEGGNTSFSRMVNPKMKTNQNKPNNAEEKLLIKGERTLFIWKLILRHRQQKESLV